MNIIQRLLVFNNHWATGLLLNTIFVNNIKKIYQHAGNCDNQQNLKDILDADMMSTPEEFTDDSPHVTMTSTQVKK